MAPCSAHGIGVGGCPSALERRAARRGITELDERAAKPNTEAVARSDPWIADEDGASRHEEAGRLGGARPDSHWRPGVSMRARR